MQPDTPERFNAIIIGVGQAGKPLAQAFAKAGRPVAIIERHFVGGSCINYGCTPTKTLIASAAMAHQARRSGDYGIETASVRVNFKAVMDRKNGIVEQFRHSIEETLTETDHLTLIEGEARFTGPKQVEVTHADGSTRTLTADSVCINCGTRPAQPDIEGLDAVPFLTSMSLLDVADLPPHLLIVGGGYIGVEFSQMFRRLGSAVTIIDPGPHLLSNEDDDVITELTRVLADEGIQIITQATVQRVGQPAPGTLLLTLKTEQGTIDLEGTHLLIATGQTPNTDSLTLETAGIATDERGFIRVNDRLETNQPGIYALGDCKGGPAFTHIAYDDFRVVKQNLLGDGGGTTQGRPLPYTIFTDPQLGRIGLTEREAKKQGKAVKIATMPMRQIGRAVETGHTNGLMKVLIDANTDQILGAAMLAMDGGELMSMIQIAMMGNLPYTQLRDAIFAHPTLAESLNNLFGKVA